MSSPVVTIKEGMELMKQIKTNIGMGSAVKAKGGELVNITREVRSRRMRKEVVGFAHSVVGKNNFLVQFEDGQKKDICSSSLVFLSPKREVEMDEPISHLSQIEEGKLLPFNGDPEIGEPCMFGKGVYLSVFYCLCCAKDIYTDMLEDQVEEERDPDLNEEEDIRLDAIRGYHWRNVAEEGDNKKNIHALRWEVYVKEKEE